MKERAMSRMLRSVMAASLLVIGMGCGEEPETPEQQAARAVFEAFESAIFGADGETAVSHMTKGSISYYDVLIDYATDGKKADVLRLSPTDKSEIVRMRNRLELHDLDKMTGRDFLIFATNEGWYSGVDDEDVPDDWINLGHIDIAGDRASGMVLDEGEKTGHFLDLYLEDGTWKVDFQSWDTLWNKYMEQIAKELDLPIDDATLQLENYEWGSVKKDVVRWTPMREWR
jgi:hypothetical protein